LLNIYDKESLIDQAIVIYYKAPKSFTGEDVVEFQCHGGVAVTSVIVECCIREGARIARAGEFTKRALLNGKIDLTQAEAIAAIIDTKSRESVKHLSRHLRGDLKELVERLRGDLVEILAHIEVNIDYAEEDLDPNIIKSIDTKLKNSIEILENSVKISKSREGLIRGYRVAIIGKPNVGKSSLLNRLLSYERAIISEIAGTTRDTIEEEINIGSHPVKIVDTAGIRDSGDEIEKIGIERSISSAKESDIIIALFDRSREFDSEDRKILEIIKEFKDKKRIFVALSKCDLPKVMDVEKIRDFNPIEIDKKRIDKLVESLEKFLDGSSFDDELILINQRQIRSVENALKALHEAQREFEQNELELFAFNINEAVDHIASITKPFERDEILDSMFSDFCLGK
jgi:tRNA modification GTPase